MSTTGDRSDVGARDADGGTVGPQRSPQAPTAVQHHAAGPDREDPREADAASRRLWFDLRPTPRQRADLRGSHRAWWALLWIVVVLLVIFPVPWWWF